MSDTTRKLIFYGGAAALAALKVYGIVKRRVPWWAIILLGVAGVITEPKPVSAGTLEEAKLKGYL